MNLKALTEQLDANKFGIRLIQQEDLEALRTWRNRDEARIWFKDSSIIDASQQARWFSEYIARTDDVQFAVMRNSSLVGFCAIYRVDENKLSAEIGRFLVAPHASGRGFMRAGCVALITVCRDVFGLRELVLYVHHKNARAINLYAHLGFKFVDGSSAGEIFREMRLSLS